MAEKSRQLPEVSELPKNSPGIKEQFYQIWQKEKDREPRFGIVSVPAITARRGKQGLLAGRLKDIEVHALGVIDPDHLHASNRGRPAVSFSDA